MEQTLEVSFETIIKVLVAGFVLYVIFLARKELAQLDNQSMNQQLDELWNRINKKVQSISKKQSSLFPYKSD